MRQQDTHGVWEKGTIWVHKVLSGNIQQFYFDVHTIMLYIQ